MSTLRLVHALHFRAHMPHIKYSLHFLLSLSLGVSTLHGRWKKTLTFSFADFFNDYHEECACIIQKNRITFDVYTTKVSKQCCSVLCGN